MTNNFGGKWSEAKLDALSKYLQAYVQALKNTNFKKYYIDAFAGQGDSSEVSSDENQTILFNGAADESKLYRRGSPIHALKVQPPFDHYIFVDANKDYIERLKGRIKQKVLDQGTIINYHIDDTNKVIPEICKSIDWSCSRAVLFLDPFAMEVKWDTIEIIAKTQAIDLWLLFPIMALNRLLPRDGDIPTIWKEKINELYGTQEWHQYFYKDSEPDLFANQTGHLKTANVEKISQYTHSRLKTIFADVAKKHLILRNSKNSPLFLFCFACGNPRGAPIALRIANHIIDKVTHDPLRD